MKRLATLLLTLVLIALPHLAAAQDATPVPESTPLHGMTTIAARGKDG